MNLFWGIPTDYRLITDYAMFWLTSLRPPARSAMLDDVIVPQFYRVTRCFLLLFFFVKKIVPIFSASVVSETCHSIYTFFCLKYGLPSLPLHYLLKDSSHLLNDSSCLLIPSSYLWVEAGSGGSDVGYLKT